MSIILCNDWFIFHGLICNIYCLLRKCTRALRLRLHYFVQPLYILEWSDKFVTNRSSILDLQIKVLSYNVQTNCNWQFVKDCTNRGNKNRKKVLQYWAVVDRVFRNSIGNFPWFLVNEFWKLKRSRNQRGNNHKTGGPYRFAF